MLKTVTYTLLTATTFQIFSAVNDFHSSIPQPVQLEKVIVKENSEIIKIRQTLTLLNRDLKFVEPISIAAKAGKIDPVLFACLIDSESEFKIKCTSPKGYVGLGQTPKAIQKLGYETVDLTLAACILREKLNTNYAKGNMLKAIQLYKGGANPEAMKYAKNVIKKYNKIKQELKGIS